MTILITVLKNNINQNVRTSFSFHAFCQQKEGRVLYRGKIYDRIVSLPFPHASLHNATDLLKYCSHMSIDTCVFANMYRLYLPLVGCLSLPATEAQAHLGKHGGWEWFCSISR